MGLSEFQPKIVDVCRNCGMALWDCEDWNHPRWEDECWDGCDHEPANDPEFEKIENELDEIIDRINKSTALMNYYRSLNEKIGHNLFG